jgi:hypothetical protein
MMIGTKEHYDLLNMFERSIAKHHRKEREDKSLWKKGVIYQDGNVNNMYLAFISGYSYGRNVCDDHQPNAKDQTSGALPDRQA